MPFLIFSILNAPITPKWHTHVTRPLRFLEIQEILQYALEIHDPRNDGNVRVQLSHEVYCSISLKSKHSNSIV